MADTGADTGTPAGQSPALAAAAAVVPGAAAAAAVREPVSAPELAALHHAVTLAARGEGQTRPNPVVGCVLLDRAGRIVGQGWHARAGGPHAEVAALAEAGGRARGATAVVTLEPCDHTGRTGPCSRALIDAGVVRVVAAVRDPSTRAAGGLDTLRAAGVEVVDLSSMAAAATPADPVGPADTSEPAEPTAVANAAAAAAAGMTRPYAAPHPDIGAAVAAAEDVNRVWLTAARTGRPFVTLKIAATLDGRVAAPDGSSRWISSPQSRAHAQRMRAGIDAIMVGVGTVLADDPRLTARQHDGSPAASQPLRVVLDSHGRTPPGALVRNADAPTLIATARRFGTAPAADHRVDIAAVVRHLAEQGHQHLLVEGGPRVAAAVIDADLVDEILLYQAPIVLGAGRIAVDGGTLTTLAQAHRFEVRSLQRLGPDVLIRSGRSR